MTHEWMERAMPTTKNKPCFVHQHLTLEESGLWEYLRAISSKSGILFLDGRKAAMRFQGVTASKLYRVRRRLIDKGWVIELDTIDGKPARRDGGLYAAQKLRALDHDDWVATHPDSCPTFDSPPFAKPAPAISKTVPSHLQNTEAAVSKTGGPPFSQVTHKLKEPSLSTATLENTSSENQAGATSMSETDTLHGLFLDEISNLPNPTEESVFENGDIPAPAEAASRLNSPPFALVQMDRSNPVAAARMLKARSALLAEMEGRVV
jgi:hypothetical protein